MKRSSAVGAIAGYVLALALLLLAIGIGVISARTGAPTHVVLTTQARAAVGTPF